MLEERSAISYLFDRVDGFTKLAHWISNQMMPLPETNKSA
jgi:hypothetical protein